MPDIKKKIKTAEKDKTAVINFSHIVQGTFIQIWLLKNIFLKFPIANPISDIGFAV